ncbi:MAG: GNAT family N-acetyltransferase [Clostridia bacterium]
MKKFVLDDFVVPEKLETEKLRLRMLSTDDVVKDYEAVMTSIEHLQSLCDPDASAIWTKESMTIEEDLRDLERHQREFLTRIAFAYTVMSLDESECLGCVYIDPSHVKEYDAEVYLWARQSELESGLEDHLFQAVQKWVDEVWPFQRVAYPGREIGWTEWRRLVFQYKAEISKVEHLSDEK